MSETASSENDYVFRYPVSEATDGKGEHSCRSDLLRVQLRNILDMLIPCSGDSEVKIDTFCSFIF